MPYVTFLLILVNIAVHVFTTPAREESDEVFKQIRLDQEKLACLVFFETSKTEIPRQGTDTLTYCREHSQDVALAWRMFITTKSTEANRPLHEHFAKKMKEWQAKRQETFFFRFAFIPSDYSPAKAVTAVFLHGSYSHLLGNMLFLYLAGIILEDTLGIVFYLVLYFLSAFSGTMLYYFFHQDSLLPLIGASGAIAGLLGAFLLRFARTKIIFWGFFWAVFIFVRGHFRLPAYLVLPLWFLLEIRNSWLSLGETTHIAYLVHIGGFVAGGAFMGLMILSGWTRRTLVEEEQRSFRARRKADTTKRRISSALAKRFHHIESLVKKDNQTEAQALAADLAKDLEAIGNLELLVDLLRLLPETEEHIRLNDRTYMELSSHLIAREDFSSAYRFLEELPRIYPNSSLAPKALFQAARLAARLNADHQRIQAKLEDLRTRFAQHPIGQQSALILENFHKTGKWQF